MDLITLILAIVVVAAGIGFVKLFSESLRFVVYILLVLLVLVYMFGVSYSEFIEWTKGILLWAF